MTTTSTSPLQLLWSYRVDEFNKDQGYRTNQYRRKWRRPGVYVFSSGETCLYVELSRDMSQRALQHIRGHNYPSYVRAYLAQRAYTIERLYLRGQGVKEEGKIITIEFMPCSKQEMCFREMQEIVERRLLFNVSVPVQYEGIT